MKTCIKCSIEKPLHEFRIGRNQCIECIKEYLKEYRQNNKEKIKEHNKEYNKEYRNKNKEKIKEYNKEYSKKNKEQLKEYRQNNKERINDQTKTYIKVRRKVDSFFKLKQDLRSRIYAAIKSKGYSKNTRTTDILGCTIEQVRTHLEQQFIIGMNWDNHGEWHIDHIIPLASAKDEQELLKLCHYTNLQPLWAEENLRKHARLDFVQSPIPNNRTY